VKSLVFRPAAAADVEDAYEWYQLREIGLGEEFLEAVHEAIRAVQTHPERYPIVHRETRRALLRRFPYGLYYRIHQERIVIVACMHGRRSPQRWQLRR